MQARLTELDPEAFDIADPEALADQVVELDPAHRELTSCLARGQPDLLDDFGLDERQCLTGRSSLLVECRSPSRPLPAIRTHGLDRPELRNLRRSEMNRLDRHLSIDARSSGGLTTVARR